MEGIKSSSSMHGFCKDAAAKIANFFNGEEYPLDKQAIQPFFDVIAEEVELLMNDGGKVTAD